jgi:hypothetical protein
LGNGTKLEIEVGDVEKIQAVEVSFIFKTKSGVFGEII